MTATQAGAAPLEPEDESRAVIYGLIARLFYAPPDQAVLAQILDWNALADTGSAFAQRWRALVEACRSAYLVALENEHTELFIGTGKAEVTPYLSHYVIRYATDNPLVELRQQLSAWGIGRKESASEPEDHISGVCEMMRMAIAVQQRPLDEQKNFFDRFLYRGSVAFCDAVSASPKADFYRRVAAFAREFFELERAGFEML